MAQELLTTLCAAESGQGYAFSADTEWQKEFEEAFPYDETPDQLTAIADIKKDMESPVPMDRLICGDVGYGKTEVAMRAAFKAVGDGKQVAVLAPTTVLCFQHFETFKERFAAFPVKIAMLSRFVPPKEQKAIVADAEAGKSRHRDRHASHLVEGREVSGSRSDDRRRRAAVRRCSQGTAEADPNSRSTS